MSIYVKPKVSLTQITASTQEEERRPMGAGACIARSRGH